MKWSESWISTLKETPKEAVARSHVFMLRAGYIFKQSSGVYGYFPLGWRVLRKIYEIIREEIEKIGGQQVDFPIVVPRNFWEKTGRYKKMGRTIFSFQDRNDQPFILGPTHEESMVEVLKGRISSYKQFPINFFQIEKKFRDEIRPRYGVMRGKEFVMMDGYSFHMDFDDLDKVYQLYRLAYRRIFARIGLSTRAVRADSGDMGGEGSEEFMVPNDLGDDKIFACDSCQYVANRELATFFVQKSSAPSISAVGPISTPQVGGIEELATFLGISPEQIVKTVVFRALEGNWVLAMTRGDREINEVKLGHLVGEDLSYEDDMEKIEKNIGPVGFLGPQNLKITGHIFVAVDRMLMDGETRVVGMNKRDMHYQGFSFSSFEASFVGDISDAQDGDLCSQCAQGHLKSFMGIEVGHIFKLGDNYTRKMEFSLLGEMGAPIYPLMGCYGIGVDRSLAAVIEQEAGETGFVLPSSISPYHVLIISIGKEKFPQVEELYRDLEKEYEVLWDDRDLSAGIKFHDSELLGIPIRMTLGKKFKEEGLCGMKHQKFSDEEEWIPLSRVFEVIRSWLEKEEKEREKVLEALPQTL